MAGRVLRVVVPGLLVGLVAAAAWLAFTGARAVAAVRDLQVAVDDFRGALGDRDLEAATPAAEAAADAAARADAALGGPVWGALAAIPYLGDTADAARVTAAAVATAAEGLGPLLDAADVFDPASLYADGRVDVEAIEAAQPSLGEAARAVSGAAAQIEAAPNAGSGAWVVAAVDERRGEAQELLGEAADALGTAQAAVSVLPGLLGADGERTWFVALQTPSEARGTGGLVGNYVILGANDGRLELRRVGSNSDFETLSALPDLGVGFVDRYGQDPRLFANSNLSPHFPSAAQLWRQFVAETFGEDVDVVVGTDVVALGALVGAAGPLTLPDGRVLDAQAAVDFGLTGVYADYPDDAEREAFQEAVATELFTALTAGTIPADALVDAVTAIVRDSRLRLWSAVETEQRQLLALPTAGSLAAPPGPTAVAVVINASGSKLDAYLDRSLRYEVGRCPVDGRVRSTVVVTLTSAIPPDAVLSDYVVAGAARGPDGPISRTQLQVHLPVEAAVVGITVDGVQRPFTAFREQGRPGALLELDLPPRQPVVVRLDVEEPASQAPATVPVQPLARDATVETTDVGCAPTPT